MSDMVPVHMPYLGESIIEATVSRWLKDLGDYVEADQPVLEVFTDKVEVQVPAPVSGHLHDIVVTVDETVLVGSTLGVIEVGGQPQGVTTPEAGQVHSIPKSCVHSRGAGNWRQLMAGSGGSQGLPTMALAMASSAVMPWAAAESR
jgi:2-oxoglutarate dehydrogenase E2 component (dihydrolipoamide succinyltransferase)